ncbi:Uncharacterised protein [Klebsiella pneumoniae]|nr:Uncharacterised protein [Klebsiella pneumoniae]
MRTPDRGSTTGAASWTDRARSKRAAPQGRAKRVNPPLTAIFEMRACTQVRALFFYILRRGDENPRPGFDNWRSQLDRLRACERAAPQGRAKRVNPPLTAIFEMRACAQVRAFFSHMAPAGGDEPPRPEFDEWQRHPDRTKKTSLMILSHFVLQGLVKQK